MNLEQSFEVEAPVEEVWKALIDVLKLIASMSRFSCAS